MNRLDPVVNEKYLTTAIYFPQNRVANLSLIKLDDEGPDRAPILRRSGNDAHVPDAGHGHIQSSRNRRCGQRQHVELSLQFLDLFLLLHTKALLFIDNEQAEFPEV